MGAVRRVYFDNAATTAVDPRVVDAMQPYFNMFFGNPSSAHSEGRQARESVEKARNSIADLMDAQSGDVIFTSSGTEADNLAILGTVRASRNKRIHVITSSIEHPAVLETCHLLKNDNVDVTYLPVGSDGIVDPGDLERSIKPETVLISIMSANNVTGAIQPIRELGRIARAHEILFHTDAVQAAGKVHLSMKDDHIDMLSLSGHKIHGPKGVGALIVRKGIKLSPLFQGGGQEKGLRSSTENVAGIIGFGEAAKISRTEMADEAINITNLRNRLIDGIYQKMSIAYIIGSRNKCLPGHICMGFSGLEGEMMKLFLKLDEAGFAVSAGSACSSHKASEPSYVLRAMGFDVLKARGALRVTLGRFNDQDEVDSFVGVFPRIVAELMPIFTCRKII